MKHVIGCLAIIENDQGEILLTQRNEPGFGRWHEKWNIPGGALEANETPEKGTLREIEEELGVEIEIIDEYPIVVKGIPLGSIGESSVILITYIARIIKGKPSNEDKETLDWRWIKPQEIDYAECMPSTSDLVTAYLAKK